MKRFKAAPQPAKLVSSFSAGFPHSRFFHSDFASSFIEELRHHGPCSRLHSGESKHPRTTSSYQPFNDNAAKCLQCLQWHRSGGMGGGGRCGKDPIGLGESLESTLELRTPPCHAVWFFKVQLYYSICCFSMGMNVSPSLPCKSARQWVFSYRTCTCSVHLTPHSDVLWEIVGVCHAVIERISVKMGCHKGADS